MEELKYTIAETAERLKITYRTLHYYEDKFNLVISRDEAGNRLYTENDIATLEMIIKLKGKGMKLDGIKTLLQEKGILDPEESSKVIVLDEKAIEAKDLIVNEIRNVISSEIREGLSETKEMVQQLVSVTQDIKDELSQAKREIERKNEEHFKMIDDKLSAWRNSKDRPWYKKLLNSKD